LFNKLNYTLQKIEATIAASSLALLLLLSLLQILLRNLFDYGYPEVDIVSRHLLVVCGMMGAVLATSKHAHIKTDALMTLLNPDIQRWLQLPLNIFSSMICLALAYYSIIYVSDEWQFVPVNERWTLPFTFIYPISFALMSLHFGVNAVQRKIK